MQARGARLALVVATALALAGLAASPRPVAAAWERLLTISFYSGGGYGDGAGRVTSDDGAIDCSWNAGVTSGDCSEYYILPNFLPTYDTTLTLTSAASSYSCLSSQSLCQPNGANQTFPVHFDSGTPGGLTLTPSFNLKVIKVNINVFGRGSVRTNGDFCSGGYYGDVCGQYKWGQTATLTAVPDGVPFTAWDGGVCSGTNLVCTFTINSLSPATGAFFGHARITFTASAGGRVCPYQISEGCATDARSYSWLLEIGSVHKVRAVPETGYRFDRWSSGPCVGQTDDCTFTVAAETTIKGFFASTAATAAPTAKPTAKPTVKPTAKPTVKPSATPTGVPTPAPTAPGPTSSVMPIETVAPSTLPPSTRPSTVPSPETSAGGSAEPFSSPAASAAPEPVVDPGGGQGAMDGSLLLLLVVVLAGLLPIAFVAGRRRRGATPPRA